MNLPTLPPANQKTAKYWLWVLFKEPAHNRRGYRHRTKQIFCESNDAAGAVGLAKKLEELKTKTEVLLHRFCERTGENSYTVYDSNF